MSSLVGLNVAALVGLNVVTRGAECRRLLPPSIVLPELAHQFTPAVSHVTRTAPNHLQHEGMAYVSCEQATAPDAGRDW